MSKSNKFYPEEIERLRDAWHKMIQRRSEGTGSAYGEHYILVSILRDCGVEDEFESSSQVENYVENILIYGEAPDVY